MPPLSPTSRYARVGTAITTLPDGREVVHLRRRLIPSPDRVTVMATHRVRQGDRLDRIAAAELGDPDQFWRICDVNGALHPRELTAEVGRVLQIALPEEG